jgi:hypothetical protein
VTRRVVTGGSRESLVSVSRRRGTIFGPLAVAVVAVLLASGCQSRAGTAAIVGDQRISDDQLQSMVRDALAAPGVRAALPNSTYKGDVAQFSRSVLYVEVRKLLAEQAASKVGITVTDTDVTERYKLYEDTNGGAAGFPAQLASNLAYSPDLFRERVRSEVIMVALGYKLGGVHRPTEAELRASYAHSTAAAPTWTLRLIQVPDEATARTVLTKVQQDPGSFATVAQQLGGQADPQDFTKDKLPAEVNAKLATAKPGDVFIFAQPGSQAYVIKFDKVTRPTFESSRPALLSQSANEAMTAGQQYLVKESKQLAVEINPRYGSWDSSQLSITDFINPVVKATPTPAATTTPAPDGSGADGSGGDGSGGDGTGGGATPSPTGG